MARRQNYKLSSPNRREVFTLPEQISKPISGMDSDAQEFINTLLFGYQYGKRIFDTKTPHHEDWIMLFTILTNEAEGRATVTKNIVEITGRAYGTVRASLQRFERLGYIEPNQKIGRSEVYVPTPKLKRALNRFSKTFWPHVKRVRGQRGRAKDLV